MKKSVLRSVVLLAVVLLMANLFGCSSAPVKDEIKPSQQNIEATKDYQAYENAQYAFKMKYPKDWQKKEESGIVVGFMSPGVSNLNIVTEDVSKNNAKLDEFVKASLPQIEKAIPSFKLVESTPIKMGNVAAQKIVYTGSFDGIDLKFMQVLTVVNKRAFVFTYTSTPGDFATDQVKAQNMIDSFTI